MKYFAKLPYDVPPDEPSQLLSIVLDGIKSALKEEDYTKLLPYWLKQLSHYLSLGYPLSKEIRVDLIQSIYLINHDYILKYIEILLKKEYLFENEDLSINFRPFYDQLKKILYPSSNAKVLSSDIKHAQNIIFMVKYLRRYFPVTVTEEILKEILPQLSPTHISATLPSIALLVSFLPSESIGDWNDTLLLMLESMNRLRTIDICLLDLYGRSLPEMFGKFALSPQQLENLAQKALDLIELPIGSGLSVADGKSIVGTRSSLSRGKYSQYQQMDNISANSVLVKYMNDPMRSIACILVFSDSVELIRRIIRCIMPFFHPSNNGKWSSGVISLVRYLCQYLQERVEYEMSEEKTGRKYDKKFYMSQETKRELVQILKQPLLLSIYGKTQTQQSQYALKCLLYVDGETLYPELIQLVTESIESVEVHRCLTGISLLSEIVDFEQEASQPLLPLILNGIDPNDTNKTLSTLRVFCKVLIRSRIECEQQLLDRLLLLIESTLEDRLKSVVLFTIELLVNSGADIQEQLLEFVKYSYSKSEMQSWVVSMFPLPSNTFDFFLERIKEGSEDEQKYYLEVMSGMVRNEANINERMLNGLVALVKELPSKKEINKNIYKIIKNLRLETRIKDYSVGLSIDEKVEWFVPGDAYQKLIIDFYGKLLELDVDLFKKLYLIAGILKSINIVTGTEHNHFRIHHPLVDYKDLFTRISTYLFELQLDIDKIDLVKIYLKCVKIYILGRVIDTEDFMNEKKQVLFIKQNLFSTRYYQFKKNANRYYFLRKLRLNLYERMKYLSYLEVTKDEFMAKLLTFAVCKYKEVRIKAQEVLAKSIKKNMKRFKSEVIDYCLTNDDEILAQMHLVRMKSIFTQLIRKDLSKFTLILLKFIKTDVEREDKKMSLLKQILNEFSGKLERRAEVRDCIDRVAEDVKVTKNTTKLNLLLNLVYFYANSLEVYEEERDLPVLRLVVELSTNELLIVRKISQLILLRYLVLVKNAAFDGKVSVKVDEYLAAKEKFILNNHYALTGLVIADEVKVRGNSGLTKNAAVEFLIQEFKINKKIVQLQQFNEKDVSSSDKEPFSLTTQKVFYYLSQFMDLSEIYYDYLNNSSGDKSKNWIRAQCEFLCGLIKAKKRAHLSDEYLLKIVKLLLFMNSNEYSLDSSGDLNNVLFLSLLKRDKIQYEKIIDFVLDQNIVGSVGEQMRVIGYHRAIYYTFQVYKNAQNYAEGIEKRYKPVKESIASIMYQLINFDFEGRIKYSEFMRLDLKQKAEYVSKLNAIKIPDFIRNLDKNSLLLFVREGIKSSRFYIVADLLLDRFEDLISLLMDEESECVRVMTELPDAITAPYVQKFISKFDEILRRKDESELGIRTRLRLLAILQVLVFRNFLVLDKRVLETVEVSLDDHSEVRHLALITLTGIIQLYGDDALYEELLVRYKDNLYGLCALVLSRPYDIPSWMPDVLAKLVGKQQIDKKTVQHTFAEFRRTHEMRMSEGYCDLYGNDVETDRTFTEEQRSILEKVLGTTTSYYA